MKKILMTLLFLSPSLGWATPPTSITLSYDVRKGVLHVDAAHQTQNPDKNFVRLMKVYVNGQEVNDFNYSRQTDYDKFTDDVQVTANIGDTIKVDLFCAEGGELAQEMAVQDQNANPAPAGNSANGG